MKNRKTKFIKLGILLFGISFLLWNCTQEEFNETEKITESKKLEYSLEKINYEGLKTDLDFQNSLKIIESKIANKKQQHHNTFHKSTTQINDDLSILTEQVNKVETNDGTITWTFETEYPVFEDSDFENFVVKKENSQFYYYLISYQINPEIVEDSYQNIKSYRVREEYLSLENLDLHHKGDDFGGTGSDNIDWVYPDDSGGDESCVVRTQYIKPCSSGGYHSLTYACQHLYGVHGVSNSPPCDDVCSGTEVYIIFDNSACTNLPYDPPSGPDNSPPNSDANNDSSIPTTGGSNDNNNSNTTVTSPITSIDGTSHNTASLIANQINQDLNNTLSKTEIDWLVENESEAKAIANITSTESSSFINASIDILSNNLSTNILTSAIENQKFLNLVGKILHLKNNIIFPEYNIVFNSLDEFNSLSINNWQLINTKALEINNATNFYDISTLSNINQLSPPHRFLVAENSLFIGFLPSVNSIIGQYWPKNDEEWAVIGNLFAQFLPELALGFIPGSDIIEVIKGANQGDSVAVAIGLAGLIVDAFGGTILKGMTKAIKIGKKVFTSFKLLYKYLKIISSALKSGLKINIDNSIVKLFNKSGNEIGNIVSNVLRLKFPVYGGDIISHPSKTTTIIGKFAKDQPNGTDALIKSGLTESINGVTSKTTFNVLNEVPNPSWTTDQQIWDNLNEPWLRDAASRNDVIRVISDPNNTINLINDKGQISFFAREHNLLTTPVSQGGLGYTYNPLTYTYTK